MAAQLRTTPPKSSPPGTLPMASTAQPESMGATSASKLESTISPTVQTSAQP